MTPALLGAVLLVGCGAPDDDYDGFSTALDCDDTDPAVSPGALELCDGIDNDCDGEVDNDPIDGGTWYVDADADGFGAGLAVALCDGTGHVANDVDCNDASADTFPGAQELCDGQDNDCDGTIDDGADQTTFYADADGDSYGDPDSTTSACAAPAGYVAAAGDCDDFDPALSPQTRWFVDSDGDSHGSPLDVVLSCLDPSDKDTDYVDSDTDCDDDDASVYPGNTAEDPTACMLDEDGDGFGTSSPPDGIDAGTDCVDDDAGIFPGNTTEDAALCMEDADGDGYGAAEPTRSEVDVGTDCDDDNAAASPGADEYCNSTDSDCNGTVDDDYALDASTWYLDRDADGFGDAGSSTVSCDQPDGYSAVDTDCDDSEASANPGEYEDCTDGIDNNCDGFIDDVCTYDTDDADVTVTGSDSNGYIGLYGLDTSGDLNGDGSADIAVGGYRAGSSYRGEVYLLAGPLTSGAALMSGDDAFATVVGEDTSDYLGLSLDVGDIDGDGYDDLVTSAHYAEDGSTSSVGGVFAFYGPLTGTINASSADISVWGVSSTDYYGEELAVIYDYDGDGAGEIIGGSERADPLARSSAGTIGIHADATDGDTYRDAQTQIIGALAGDQIGTAFSGCGDLNGDGSNDLLYGAYGAETAYALFGPTTGTVDAADASASFRSASSSYAGSTVDAGDYNGDGHTDVIIGAFYDTCTTLRDGCLYVVYGPVTGSYTLSLDADAQISGSSTSESLGRYDSAMHSGDVNGDGSDDLLVGSYLNDTAASNHGGAFLFYGALSGSHLIEEADVLVFGSNSYTGTAVSMGDISGDGSLDVAASSYYAASADGEIYVLFNGSF